LIINSFLGLGIFLSSKKASIFLTIISQSLRHFSFEDFNSDFSSGSTFHGTHKVAIIDAATK
jgi:hypothetical protein